MVRDEGRRGLRQRRVGEPQPLSQTWSRATAPVAADGIPSEAARYFFGAFCCVFFNIY